MSCSDEFQTSVFASWVRNWFFSFADKFSFSTCPSTDTENPDVGCWFDNMAYVRVVLCAENHNSLPGVFHVSLLSYTLRWGRGSRGVSVWPGAARLLVRTLTAGSYCPPLNPKLGFFWNSSEILLIFIFHCFLKTALQGRFSFCFCSI